MGKVPFYSAGMIGVIKDISPEEIDPRAWSDVRNFKFEDGKAIRAFDPSSIFGTPLGNPYWLLPVQGGATAFWVYADLTKLYITDGSSHADASGSAYTMNVNDLWIGGLLSGTPVITNGFDKPQFLASPPALSSNFADLTNWPAGDICGVIRPFNSFLVALDISRGGANYPHLIKWSHPAAPGGIPSSWDETDPTKLAGEVEIVDEFPGGIKDALPLRDILVIYKDNTTWGMQYIGGNNVFRFYKIFINSGIMSKHCVCAIDKGDSHFVLTGEDVILHDGQTSKSVLDKRDRKFIFDTLPHPRARNCYVTAVPENSEAWAFIPQSGGMYPTIAVIYNWRHQTTTIKDLGAATSYSTTGPIAETSDPWDSDPASWDSDTTKWDEALFSPHFQKLLSARPDGNAIVIQEAENVCSGNPDVCYIERTGIAVVGQDKLTGEYKADNDSMKILSRIWVKANGGSFNVRIGGAEFHDSPVVWDSAQVFTPGVDKYLDFYPVNARFLAVKFSNTGTSDSQFKIEGFDLEIEILGEQ